MAASWQSAWGGVWDFLRGNDLKGRLPPAGPLVPPLERKQYPDVPGGVAFWPGVPPQPGPGQYQRFLPGSPPTWVPAPGDGGYGGGGSCNVANSAVFACLNAIATAFPEPPLRVYRRQPDGEPEARPDHPLQPLLQRPNPAHSAQEVWYWTQWAKHADGNAYWRKVRAGHPERGNVVEVWPLSPARVEPVTTAADRRAGRFISYYRYETALGQYDEIAPENLVHFRLGLEDADHRLGCSPLKRLLREVASDDEITRFMLNLLGNFAVPGLVVTTQDRTMSAEDAEQIKASITDRFSGDHRGRVGVLNNGASIQQFGFSPEQLDMKTLHRVPEERIAAVMGVPAIVAGLGAGLERCIIGNMRVATPDHGPVPIAALRPGDRVWAYRDGGLRPCTVRFAAQTGTRPVFRVRTPNRTITATDNHPFLVRRMEKVPGPTLGKRNGLEWRYWLDWVPLRDLVPGDAIVAARHLPDRGGTVLPDGTAATEPLLEWLGAFVGDGCLTGGARDVGISMAIPATDRVRPYYEAVTRTLFTKYAGGGTRPAKRAKDGLTEAFVAAHQAGEAYRSIGRRYGMHNATVRDRIQTALHPKPALGAPVFVQSIRNAFRISTASGSRWVRALGFHQGARTKRVPGWVFGLAEPLRLAFLRGVLDTDGSVGKRGLATFTFASEELTWDLWHLCLSCGLQVCNVRHGVIPARKLPNAGLQDEYDYWTFTVTNPYDVRRIGTHDPLYQERLAAVTAADHRPVAANHPKSVRVLPEGCAFTKIQSITPAGIEDVYDLTVEGAHNFIAQGLLVHNSTYANFREAREMFTEQKLCPLWVFDAGTIDLQLLPDFDGDPDTFTRFDLTEVRALAPDLNETYTRVNVGVQGKWITVNEARKEVGLPAVDGGDALARAEPQPGLPPSETSSSAPPARLPPPPERPALPPPGASASESGAFSTSEQKAIGLPLFPALMDAMRELARPGFERDLEAYWTAQHQRVIQALIRDG